MKPLDLAIVAALLAAVVSPAGALSDDIGGERARIARERAEADARYAERAAQCRQRFVVTACIDDARAERRDALGLLSAQQQVLDEAARKRRAAARIDRIRSRIDAEPAPPVPLRPVQRASLSAEADAARAERERASVQRYEARQRKSAQRSDPSAKRGDVAQKPKKRAKAPATQPDAAAAAAR